MKIKTVRFMALDGAAVAPRTIPGLGRVSGLAIGDVVKDVVDGEAIISALDYEPRSGAIVIRKARKDDNPRDASRSWNRSPREGNNLVGREEPKGDWCAISIGTAQIVGDDAVAAEAPKKVEAKLEQQPVQDDAKSMAANEEARSLANAAAGLAQGKQPEGEVAKQEADPPRAQPIQKQGQGQQRR